MPPRRQPIGQPPRSNVIQTVLAIIIIAVAAGGGYYWFNLRESPDQAAAQLAQQGIEVTPENFFAEIQAGHAGNIHNFLLTGAQPGTLNGDGLSALMLAAQSGDKDTLTQLLLGLPANPPDASAMLNFQEALGGKTALIFATEKGSPGAVSALLSYDADTALTDKQLETPLIIAVKHKYTALLPLLIAADAKQHQSATINAADTHGETPLTYAIREGSKEIVDTLLVGGADAITPDRSDFTPLMVAAETGEPSIGERLIEMGAKPNTADKSGNTPLTLAILHDHPQFAHMLLSSGADPDFHVNGPFPLQVAIGAKTFNTALFTYLLSHSKQAGSINASVLFDALDNKNGGLVKTLLDYGISAKAVNASGETLLYRAIENNLEDAAITLIDKGADINRTGAPGITPLERAAKHNEFKVVQKLLSLGVPPDQKTTEGYTIAEMAVYSGYPEVLDALLAKGAKLQKDFGVLWSIRDGKGLAVPVLLKYGAHPTVMSASGEPALWLAASAGEIEAVAALIRYHASIDYPNSAQSMTPLGIASHSGQLAVAKLLVESGAKIEATDAYGMTPLAQAAYMTKPDVVDYLIGKRANVHATDKQGRSIMDLATLGEASGARDRVIALLQQQK